MANETLEEKKQEEEAHVEEKEEPKPEQEEEEKQKQKENPEKEVSQENNEPGEKTVEEKMNNEEAKQVVEKGEGSKKGKRSESRRKKRPSKELMENKEKEKEKEKEVATPGSERPTRERKMVERYSAPEPGRSASKPLSIEKGRGMALKDIPNVAYKLSKRKPDDNLQLLHTILFGKKGKAHNLKKNIGQFSGYVWAENEEKQKAKVREKLDKCVKEKLMDFCDVLNIPINKASVKKEELTVKILDFLESPHATTDVLLADKEQKGKKRKVSTGKITSPAETSAAPAKKRKQTPHGGEKWKHSSKDEEDDDADRVESPDAKDESQEDAENDMLPKEWSDSEVGKSDEEDEPKEQTSARKSSSRKTVKDSSVVKSREKPTPGKKSTPTKSVKSPAKSTKKSSGSSKRLVATDIDGTSGSYSKSKGSAPKKQKVGKENPKDRSASTKERIMGKKQPAKSPAKASVKDQGKVKSSKKAKAEPTREEMHAVVVDILKVVDFNTATLSDILRHLGTHFGVDLLHRKAEVKDIITEVINNMSDEEEEREETEDNAETGGDADKDEDGDEDA